MTQYAKLFSVSCKHDYYPDGNTSDLQFSPTAECQMLLKNLGLLFKQARGGFYVLYTPQDGVQHVLEKLTSSQTFSFSIQFGNPSFFNFSAFPSQKSAQGGFQGYHFQNKGVSKKGEKCVLQQGDVVGEADLLSMRGQNFDYKWETGKQPKTIKVENEAGETVFEKQISDQPISGIFIQLSDKPNGKFSLIADERVVEHFISVPNNPSLFGGLLQIHFGDIAAPDYELIKDGKITPQDYVIDFSARETYWKYFIAIREKDKYGKPEILKGNGKTAFLEAEDATMPDGSSGYMIKSQSPIPLRQVYSETFKLRLSPISSGIDPVTMALPCANPQGLSPEKKDGNPVLDENTQKPAFNSEIYVYI